MRVMHLRSADCALLLVDLRVNNSFFTHWRVRRICVACIFVPDSMPFGHAVTEVTIVLVSHDSLLFTMSSVWCGAVRSLHNSQRMKRRKKKNANKPTPLWRVAHTLRHETWTWHDYMQLTVPFVPSLLYNPMCIGYMCECRACQFQIINGVLSAFIL